MDERDLQLARAMVEEEEAMRNKGTSPGGSPAPLKKTPVGKVMEKMNAFRSGLWKNCVLDECMVCYDRDLKKKIFFLEMSKLTDKPQNTIVCKILKQKAFLQRHYL